MFKRAWIIVSFYLFFSFSNSVNSNSINERELQGVMESLIIWLNDQNHFNYQNISAPNISIVSAKEICLLAYGEKSIHKEQSNKCTDIFGLYNFKNSRIYLSNDLDLNSLQGQSVLLHELVHHFQYKSGEANKVSHISQLEPYAYFLERKFNRQFSLIASSQDSY